MGKLGSLQLIAIGWMRAPLQPIATIGEKGPKSLSLLAGALTGLPTNKCGEGISSYALTIGAWKSLLIFLPKNQI